MHCPLAYRRRRAFVMDLFSGPMRTMLRELPATPSSTRPGCVVIPPRFRLVRRRGDLLVGNFGDGTINAYTRHWRRYRPDAIKRQRSR